VGGHRVQLLESAKGGPNGDPGLDGFHLHGVSLFSGAVREFRARGELPSAHTHPAARRSEIHATFPSPWRRRKSCGSVGFDVVPTDSPGRREQRPLQAPARAIAARELALVRFVTASTLKLLNALADAGVNALLAPLEGDSGLASLGLREVHALLQAPLPPGSRERQRSTTGR
jgi:hypothetical protein